PTRCSRRRASSEDGHFCHPERSACPELRRREGPLLRPERPLASLGVTVVAVRLRPHWRRAKYLPYLLLPPAFRLLAGGVSPVGLALSSSSTSYWPQYPNGFRSAWFDNSPTLLDEPLFVRALEFTLGFTVVAVVLQVGLGLAVALFLHARIPGRAVLRAL